MPTYSSPGTLIYQHSSATPDSVLGSGRGNHRQFYIDETGRWWYAYLKVSASAYTDLACAYSDNNGATWTEEIIEDGATWGSFTSVGHGGAFGEANNGDIVFVTTMDSGNLGVDRYHIYRRTGASTWVHKVSVSGGGASFSSFPMHSMALYNHPNDDNRWILVGPYQATDLEPAYWLSTNDLTSFGSQNVLTTSGNNKSNQMVDRGGSVILRNADKTKIAYIYNNNNGTTSRWRMTTIQGWDGTPSTNNTNFNTQGGTTYHYGPIVAFWKDTKIVSYAVKTELTLLDIWRAECSDPFGTPSVSVADTGVNIDSVNSRLHYCSYEAANEIMTWWGKDDAGAVTHRRNFDESAGNEGNELSSETFNNGQTAIDPHMFLGGMNQVLDYGYLGDERYGPIVGGLYVYTSSSSSVERNYYGESSDLTKGSGSGGVPVSASESFTLVETATTPDTAATITADTFGGSYKGGRQTVRASDGTYWHVSFDSATGYPRAWYSALGNTWTEVNCESKTGVGAAMCIGVDGDPVIAYSRNNQIRFLKYDGSEFVYIANKATGDVTTESFQILYDGTQYHLLYADRNNSGTRRIRHATSTDLITWTTSNLYTSSNSSYKPWLGRRVSLARGLLGSIHAFYTVRTGGTYDVVYRKYTAGTWGSELTIDSGHNSEPLYFSMTVNVVGTAELAYGRPNSLYPNRTQIWHAWNNAGVWEKAAVSLASADTSQGPPAILASSSSIYIWWEAEQHVLGKNLFSTSTLWSSTHTLAQWASGDEIQNFQTVDGPDGNNYQRVIKGYAFSYALSEHFFELSGTIYASGADAAEQFTLAENAYLQGFPFADETLTLTESSTGAGVANAAESLTLSDVANLTYTLPPASEEFTLQEQAQAGETWGAEFISLSESGTRLVLRGGTALETFTLTELAGQGWDAIAEDTFDLSESGDVIRRFIVLATETLSLVGASSEVGEIQQVQVESFSLSEGSFVLPNPGCDTSYSPSPALPANENDILYTYLAGPFGTWTYTMRLKRPEYGDIRRSALQTIVQRSRGGDIRLFKRNPTYKQLVVDYSGLSMKEMLELENFVQNTKGEYIRYIDRFGHVWKVFILDEEIDFAAITTDRGGTAKLVMEGSVTGASS